MLLVTGATGHLGKEVVKFLISKVSPKEIAILARSEAKAKELELAGVKIQIGDYRDYNSLTKAFQGIEKILLISSSDLHDRATQHINAIKAAKEVGIKHIYYTSFQRKKEDSSSPIWFIAKDHLETEKYLKESGIAYTIFRNGFYMDIIPDFIGNAVETGKLIFPAGNGKISCILRKDIAETIANVLLSKGHENKEYEIANDTSYPFQEVANTLSKITNRQVEYFSPTPQEYKEQLLQLNLPQMLVEMSTAFGTAFSLGEMDIPSPTAKQILGRELTTLAEFLTQYYKSKQIGGSL